MATKADGQGQRRCDLDWLRIGAFAILILYHVGMFYVPWDWHLKSRHVEPWVQVPMALVNPWRLTLLFIVSGAATRFLSERLTIRTLITSRIGRLLPPLLFGMLVIVPPQTFAQVSDLTGQTTSYLSFYLRYLSGTGDWTAHGAELVTPTWNHLWFVAYLLVYTLILASVLALLPRSADHLSRCLERLLSGWRLVLLPVAWFTFVHVILLPRWPENHALFGDWTVHAQSLPAFLFGFALARSDGPRSWIMEHRRATGAFALTALITYVGALGLWIDGIANPAAAESIIAGSFGAAQWLTCIALLGFADAHLGSWNPPARAHLTEAIFPFYIVHQTIIILAGWWLRDSNLPAPIEAPLLILLTTVGCFATFEIARRICWLRPLFGLRRRPAPKKQNPHPGGIWDGG